MATQSQLGNPLQTPETPPMTFTDEELTTFDADDVVAGSTIAKILCTLFVYTLLAMLVVVWWTVRVVLP